MKKIYLIFFLLPKILFAQDFGNIITAGRTYYTDSINNPGYLAGIKIDSVFFLGNDDTIFLANNTIRPYLHHPNYDTVGGILGRKIYKQNNGWFYFFNIANDTLYMKSQALLNESWKFCNLPHKGYLQATCSSINDTLILGIPDTVKEISFQAKDSTGLDIPNFYNGQSILLGQKYGFTRVFDLHQMPDTSRTYALVGRNHPTIGFQGLTWQEVNEFEVGDEFHYTGEANSAEWHDHITDDYNQIQKVLEKDAHPESGYVNYTMENCKDEYIVHSYSPTPPYHIYTYDTVPVTCTYNSLPADPTNPFMPEQYINDCNRYYSTLYHSIPGRPSNGYIEYYYCYSPPYPRLEYVKGLGKTDTETLWIDWPPYATYIDYTKLVYFKKGNETWGNPVATDCSTLLPIVSFHPDTLVFQPPYGSRDTLFVSCTGQWHIVNTSCSWLNYQPISGSGDGSVIFITSSPYSDKDPRYSSLKITGPMGTKTFYVKQWGNFYGIENKSQTMVSISPNPIKTFADISVSGFPSKKIFILTVSDLTGRTVFQSTLESPLYHFERGKIPSGMYLFKVITLTGDKSVQTKIVLE